MLRPRSARSQVLLAGLAVQSASVVFLTLIQLFVVLELQRPAADFAQGVLGLRYAAIAGGVMLASPLGTTYGAAWLLKRSLLVTAASLVTMMLGGFDVLRIAAAVGSASSAVGMVTINALLQAATQGSTQNRARLNAHYRLMAVGTGCVLPTLTTHILLPHLPEATGYPAAFALVAALCLVAAAALGPEAGALLPGDHAEAVDDAAAAASALGPGAVPAAVAAPTFVSSLTALLHPFAAVGGNAQARRALAKMMLLSLPTHVYGAFKGSLLYSLGGSQAFQGAHNSLSSGLAFGAVFLAQAMVQRMPASRAYALLSLVNSVALVVMGVTDNLHLVAVAALISTFFTKATPLAHSVWMSESVPTYLLTAAFATEKVVNSLVRSLWSTALGELSNHYRLGVLFIGSGLFLAGACVIELARGDKGRLQAGIEKKWVVEEKKKA